MASRPLNLFGEEIQPEQINAIGKSRAVAKNPKSQIPNPKESSLRGGTTKQPKSQKTNAKPDILKDWKADKQYYSIGEVAILFGVKTSNIRFWTKEFEMKVRTTRKGDRLYNPDQVRELKIIYHLVKERGFTINGAKAKLKSNKKGVVESVDLKQSLLQLRNKLLQIRNQLA